MKKGQRFFITSGEYSDYTVGGHFIANRDFSLKEQRNKYQDQLPLVPVLEYGENVPKTELEIAAEIRSGRNPTYISRTKYVRYETPKDTGRMRKEYSSVDGFQAFLIKQGLVEEVENVEAHYDSIGTSYCDID